MGGFPVHPSGQFASILFYMDVKEGNGSFGLLLHYELDFCTPTIQILKETLQFLATIIPDDKGVIHIG